MKKLLSVLLLVAMVTALCGSINVKEAKADEWGPWSDWSETYVESSPTRQVETKTVEVPGKTIYRYHNWTNEYGNDHFCPYTGAYYYGGTNWQKKYFEFDPYGQ